MGTHVLTHLWYAGMTAFGLVAVSRRLRRGGVVLCFHNVVSRPSEAANADIGLHAAREHFENEMRWLKQQCDVVSLDQMAERIAAGNRVTGLAAVTFDDGYAGALQHGWPICRDLRVPATVFVVSDGPGNLSGFWWDYPSIARDATVNRKRWLFQQRGDHREIVPEGLVPRVPRALRLATWDMLVQAQQEGLEIGCHSATHRTLTQLTDEELEREIEGSRETIAARMGCVPRWFSYPFGVWDERVRDRVEAAGYRGAVTLDSGLNTQDVNPWALRRVNIPSSLSLPAFNAWSAGILGNAALTR